MENAKNQDKGLIFQERFNELVGNATQEEIAKKLNTSRQNVGNWKKGKSRPDIFALAEISKAYNVSTDYLLGLTDIKSTDTTIKDICEYIGCTEKVIKKIRYLYTAFLELSFDHEEHSEIKSILNSIFEDRFIDFLSIQLFFIKKDSNEYTKEPKKNIEVLTLDNIYHICSIFNIDTVALIRKIEVNKSKAISAKIKQNLKIADSIDLLKYRTVKGLEDMLDEYDKKVEINNYSTKEEWLNYFDMTEQEFYKFWGIEK